MADYIQCMLCMFKHLSCVVLVRELPEEVLPLPQHGGADVPGARLLQVWQAARVQEHVAACAPRVAERHDRPVQRGPHPPEAGHIHLEGREEQSPDRVECSPRPRVGT